VSNEATIDLCGEHLTLLPHRAVYWRRRRTLLAADLHFGKPDAFRAAAVPVPFGTNREMLDRLDDAIRLTSAERIVILGDFWHARQGRSEQLEDELTAWRRRWAHISIEVVLGNHDRHAGGFLADWEIVTHRPHMVDPPFVFAHYPDSNKEGYVLAGHLHPAVRLMGPGRQRLRLPCFWFGAESGVLPAFGAFTGMADVRPTDGDRVFVVAEDQIVSMTGS
jgi:DNA ligase-associated metallophosphoesterase